MCGRETQCGYELAVYVRHSLQSRIIVKDTALISKHETAHTDSGTTLAVRDPFRVHCNFQCRLIMPV